MAEFPRTEGVHLLPGTAVVAVASCSLSVGTLTEAEATAEQRARKQIAEFIGCIVEGRTEESLRMLARDTASGVTREAEESFIQSARSSSRAFLHGVRRVATWRNNAGDVVYVAVQCAPHEAAGFASAQAALTAPSDVRADVADNEVIVEGFAEYRAGNLAGTRDEAIRDALRRAVAMVAGVVLDAQTMSGDQRVRERIVSQSDGYVSSYTILTEELTGEQRYCVRVRARVNTGKVRNNVQAMRSLHGQLNNPKVMCLFVETLNGQHVANSRLINVLENMLRDQGIELVDQTQVLAAMADMDKDYYAQCVRDSSRAAEFGRTHGAEVIIVGENKLQHLGRDPDGVFEQVTALVTIKALNASTAKILATATQSKDGIDTSVDGAAMMACKRVAHVVQQELLPRLVATWQQEANSGVRLTVVLDGADRYKLAREFRAAIERVPGVLSVDQRAWRPRDRRLELDLQYRGDVNAFLDAAYEAVSSVSGLEDVEPEQKGNAFVFRLISHN